MTSFRFFSDLAGAARGFGKRLRTASPAPCWTEYLRQTHPR